MSIDGQFGGRITFEFNGVYIPPCEGNFVIDPANRSTTAIANQDGSAAYQIKPKLYGCDLHLRNADGVDWNGIMLVQSNCTITEEDNARTHLFTNCRLVGDPKVDMSTGEVSGLRVEGPQYQKI